jgi:hypothetical protein
MAVLVESALRIIVLAAVVAVGLRVLCVASPRIAHHAWTGVCAVMLLLPAIVVWAPETSVPILPPRTPAVVIDTSPTDSGGIVSPLSVDGTTDPNVASDRVAWQLIVRGAYAVGVVLLIDVLDVALTLLLGNRVTHVVDVEAERLGVVVETLELQPRKGLDHFDLPRRPPTERRARIMGQSGCR